jgi:hypothetical protein
VAENGDVYFLSPELLHGSNGVANQENLYVYRNEKVHFVASLSPAGRPCVLDQGEKLCSETAVARMNITPDDSYMAFLTASQVTSYENEGKPELYRYTPSSDELICVSCIPSGEPPDPTPCVPYLPCEEVTASHNGLFMTNDGRTFFETGDALVSQDTNETRDVYEFVEGRPQSITGGTGVGNEAFGLQTIMALPGLVGVSADGTDVYFSTYDVLVGQDGNGEAVKIYDARSGGGFQFTPPVPPCVAADECHGPGSSAPGPAPSGTGSDLGGSGNLQPAARPDRGRRRHKKHRRHPRQGERSRHGHRKGHRHG